MIKATAMGFTFTADTSNPRKAMKLAAATVQRIREQYLVMKASMDSFETSLQRLAITASMTTGAMGRLRAKIEGYKARITGRDDRAPDPQLEQVPASPFGWIVDVVARYPGPKGGSTLLIPRRVETTAAAIERLANSTTWSRGQLRYVANVLEKSREFDYWRIPGLIGAVVRCHIYGMPLDPHELVRLARASRWKKQNSA